LFLLNGSYLLNSGSSSGETNTDSTINGSVATQMPSQYRRGHLRMIH